MTPDAPIDAPRVCGMCIDDLPLLCSHSHSYPASAHSAEENEDDEYYESEYECYNCDCSCHFVECDHEEGCECEHNMEDAEGDEANHHSHHDECEDENHDHTCDHHHHHHHQHQNHDDHHHTEHGNVAELEPEIDQPIAVPNPYLTHPQPAPLLHQQEQASLDESNMSYAQAFEAYQDQRDSAAKGLNEISGMFKAAGWPGYGPANGNDVASQPLTRVQPDSNSPRKRLADDPERLVCGSALWS